MMCFKFVSLFAYFQIAFGYFDPHQPQPLIAVPLMPWPYNNYPEYYFFPGKILFQVGNCLDYGPQQLKCRLAKCQFLILYC